MTGSDRVFPIRFTGLNSAMAVLGITRRLSTVRITRSSLEVRMSWAFRATVPLRSVTRATHDTGRVWGWGAHGWRGEWLINGSSSGIVRVEIEPAVRAWLMFVVPVRLRVLRVSVDQPDELITALSH